MERLLVLVLVQDAHHKLTPDHGIATGDAVKESAGVVWMSSDDMQLSAVLADDRGGHRIVVGQTVLEKPNALGVSSVCIVDCHYFVPLFTYCRMFHPAYIISYLVENVNGKRMKSAKHFVGSYIWRIPDFFL